MQGIIEYAHYDDYKFAIDYIDGKKFKGNILRILANKNFMNLENQIIKKQNEIQMQKERNLNKLNKNVNNMNIGNNSNNNSNSLNRMNDINSNEIDSRLRPQRSQPNLEKQLKQNLTNVKQTKYTFKVLMSSCVIITK